MFVLRLRYFKLLTLECEGYLNVDHPPRILEGAVKCWVVQPNNPPVLFCLGYLFLFRTTADKKISRKVTKAEIIQARCEITPHRC